MYRMPIEISFWGNLDKLKPVRDKLMRHGFSLHSTLVEIEGPSGSGAPVYVPQAAKGKSVVLSQAEVSCKWVIQPVHNQFC